MDDDTKDLFNQIRWCGEAMYSSKTERERKDWYLTFLAEIERLEDMILAGPTELSDEERRADERRDYLENLADEKGGV